MPFLTPLDARLLENLNAGREVWRLLADLTYWSDLLGRLLVVPAGFASDGESVPRLIAAVAGPPCRQAGTLHDFLYATHLVTKDEADAVYREALLSCGIDPLWAEQRVAAVQFYGGPAWDMGPRRYGRQSAGASST